MEAWDFCFTGDGVSGVTTRGPSSQTPGPLAQPSA